MKSGNHFQATLIADLGGTNARFQILVDPNSPPQSFEPIQTTNFETIEDAIKQSVLQQSSILPTRAIIAAAGPITEAGIRLTNSNWEISPKTFLQSCGLNQLVLMNDFEAQALALPYLAPNELQLLGSGGDIKKADGSKYDTKIVLGPGTGLGVCLLIRVAEKWVPVAGEGGHVDLGPRSSREEQIWKYLQKADGRVSAEQILSGDGLLNLYTACCQADRINAKLQSAPEVSKAAMEGCDEQAVEALEVFCQCLGRIAGDLALTSAAKGGVYIAGGIVQKILPYLQ
ncbi:MAG: ROK family protein, partial [Rhizobiaceae bacterium]